ncbi:CENP-B N-terminal DNA-binding domain [Popillia japonica]|uniref:CENP-B N-terminal DNA-binding domain n=1 Tax=Popillia japonica TaxID=7064 RepID=A0AAW1L580_POPJA
MSKKRRAQWSEEALGEALEAIKAGTSINQASKYYAIPRTTLGLHYRNKNPNKRIGRKSVLNQDQENDLVARIHKLAEIGMPVTSKVVRKSVFSYAAAMNIPTPFSRLSEAAGRKWLKLFFRRHPDVARRKAQHLNSARAQKMNRFIVNDYFSKLKDIFIKLELFDKPGNNQAMNTTWTRKAVA